MMKKVRLFMRRHFCDECGKRIFIPRNSQVIGYERICNRCKKEIF